jgi:hypothetical protein
MPRANIYFKGPENYAEDRIVVFVQARPESKPAYDGYTATDEVQFPLLMAELCEQPGLKKKFVQLFYMRYQIVCASQTKPPHPMKRLPDPTYSQLKKVLKASSNIVDEMCDAIRA